MSLQLRVNEGHLQLLRDGALLAWTDGTKTRVNTCVALDYEKSLEISLDMRMEKLKNGHVVISRSPPEQMVGRLERRMTEPAPALLTCR
jgi:hypothetical protein